MRKARLLKSNVIITADQVKSGEIDRHEDFIDVEENFRVTFVKSAKNGGSPYFRLYYCLEDYQKYTPERKRKFEILKTMRHFEESEWHKRWESNLESFCNIEKTIKDINGTYKRTDAFHSKHNLCIEFQHSYIAEDFEYRNDFYSRLGYKTIWLYDLTQHNAKEYDNGMVELVEDNARGFFRVADEKFDLSKHNVFIQMRDGTIYKVNCLYRKIIEDKNKSTIRYFYKSAVFDEEGFINSIRDFSEELFIDSTPKSIPELWKKTYSKMIVENIQNGDQIIVYGDNGRIRRDLTNEYCIVFRYVNFFKKSNWYEQENEKFYSLAPKNYKEKKWKLLSFRE